MVSVAIFAPLVDAGGAFFCLEVFPIFIKFYGGAVFLYSIVIPDFLEIESWLRNSVCTMTPRHGSIWLGGGRVGSRRAGNPCQGYLATPRGILDASVGNVLADSVCLARLRGFSFGSYL